MILELADHLATCSESLTRAAEREGELTREPAELRRTVLDLCWRFPCFGTLAIGEKLAGRASPSHLRREDH